MNEIQVSKHELLEKLKTNLDEHRNLFLRAQSGYRNQVIDKLESMLRDAREGKKIRRGVELVEPVDHSEDYVRVIAMLSMNIEDTIEISERDFNKYVLDKWDWSVLDFANKSSYT